MKFTDAVERLEILPTPLPIGRPELMPVFTDGRLRPRLSPSATARPAAVLVLLFPGDDGEARLVLTERLTYDGHHSGEVSFPGGKSEPEDGGDPTVTALREAAEETGLVPQATRLRFLGRLDEVFIPVSDFRITPVVAAASLKPELTPNRAEVARILTPSIDAFLPAAPIELVERTIGDWPIRYGGFRIEGLHVWGATARILGQLGAILESADVGASAGAVEPPGARAGP
jgi:8-oxo-dGTP pyrophosphatase MutT (NUDIX family)